MLETGHAAESSGTGVGIKGKIDALPVRSAAEVWIEQAPGEGKIHNKY